MLFAVAFFVSWFLIAVALRIFTKSLVVYVGLGFILSLFVLVALEKIFYKKVVVDAPVVNTKREEIKIELSPEQRAEEERKKIEKIAKEEQEYKKNNGLVWTYNNYDDKMEGSKGKTAYVQSLNSVEFKFPYNGTQRAILFIIKPPHGQSVATININKGQFLCGIDDCYVRVKFDDSKPITYKVSEPSDRSTTALIIDNSPALIEKIKKSKKLLVEAEFFQEGRQVFEFDSSNLEW